MLSFYQLIDPEYENDEWEEIEFTAWKKNMLVVSGDNQQEMVYSTEDLRKKIQDLTM